MGKTKSAQALELYKQGMGYADIAKQIGSTEDSVKVMVYRLRNPTKAAVRTHAKKAAGDDALLQKAAAAFFKSLSKSQRLEIFKQVSKTF